MAIRKRKALDDLSRESWRAMDIASAAGSSTKVEIEMYRTAALQDARTAMYGSRLQPPELRAMARRPITYDEMAAKDPDRATLLRWAMRDDEKTNRTI